MRARRPANLDERLVMYAAAIEEGPASLCGSWRARRMPDAAAIKLDLGCGKGGFLAQAAKAEPGTLFIGLDNSPICITAAARLILEEGIGNVRLILGEADDIESFFAPGELDVIFLNFNAPFPKRKYAEKRLTYLDRLMAYRRLLGPDGLVDLRTDNMPYWRFSLTQFKLAGYRITQMTEDLHAQAEPGLIRSEYDRKLVRLGAVVYALRANPGPEPQQKPVQDAPLSLVEYLPEDLDQLDRIPYGMEGTIENMRGRKANQEKRARHRTRG